MSIVYDGDTMVGLVTSGGYGYRMRQSIALAYVRTDLAVPGTVLEVEILGERRRAVVGKEPLYDPENARLRGNELTKRCYVPQGAIIDRARRRSSCHARHTPIIAT